MQGTDENTRRLEKVNRNLTIGVIALVIVVIFLVLIDFG